MGIILEAVRRVRNSVKLQRGQCRWCNTPLPDDETTAFCSKECAEARLEANAC